MRAMQKRRWSLEEISSQKRGLFCAEASHMSRMSLVGFLSQFSADAALKTKAEAKNTQCHLRITFPPI